MSTSPHPVGERQPAFTVFGLPLAAGERRRACAADLVLQTAQAAPQAIALSAGGAKMTYAELADRSMRLAGYLKEMGAGPETPVGLCLERSFDFVVSSLAVLAAGAP